MEESKEILNPDLKEISNEIKSAFEKMKTNVVKNQGDIDAVRKEVEATKKQLLEFSAELKKSKEKTDPLQKEKTDPLQYDAKQAETEYQKKFLDWVRTGKPFEAKMMSSDSDPAGGYLMPTNLFNRIIEKASKYSPMLEIATVVNLNSGDTLEVPVEGSTAFGVEVNAERETRTATTSGTFEKARIVARNYEADPVITNTLLEDSAFNLEEYITRKIAKEILVKFGTDTVTGTGVEGVTGFTTETIQSELSGSSGALAIATLPKLQLKVAPAYRVNGKWAANGATIANIIGLAMSAYQPVVNWNAGTGRYTLFGQDIIEMPDLPDIGSSAYPIYYGDWQEACMCVVRQDIRILRDPYKAHGFTYFYATWRLGFKTVNTSALAKMKSNNS